MAPLANTEHRDDRGQEDGRASAHQFSGWNRPPFDLCVNNILNEADADDSVSAYQELFLVQNAHFLDFTQVA